jgi:hypothetical protein
MIVLRLVRTDTKKQISKAVSIAQLSEYHAEKLVPACKMLDPFIALVFAYTTIKYPGRQKSSNLRKDVFALIHNLSDLQQVIKLAISNRHRSKFRPNLYPTRLSKN